MPTPAVLYDACTLYPAPLRDLFMRLALTDLFRAKWTNEIHDEWIRNVLANRRDLSPEFLHRTRSLMNSHIRDCLVEDYQELIASLRLPDPNDRHVLAAAIHSGCSIIVTYNLKDFPTRLIEQYGIEALHPDMFIVNLLEHSPVAVLAAMQKHRTCLKSPPKTVEQYLETLLSQSLIQTTANLQRFKGDL